MSRADKQIAEYFDIADEIEWSPRYNIAPAQPVAVVRQNPERPVRHLSLVRWGLKYCTLVSAASALRDSGSF
jgi:putative SOS response-associated peptidase YedK